MIEQGDNWDKVMTDDGIIGYMQKRMLSSVKEKTRQLAKTISDIRETDHVITV